MTISTRDDIPRTGNARVLVTVDFAQTANLVSSVKSRMHFSLLYQTKPLQAHSHFPLSQLQMSPLACLQWALCCLPVMACEISIIIVMAPRAAMSADGRSLIGNELSPHPKGTCLLLLLFRSMQSHRMHRHVSMYEDEGDLEERELQKMVPGAEQHHYTVAQAAAANRKKWNRSEVSTKCHPRFSLHADIHPLSLP